MLIVKPHDNNLKLRVISSVFIVSILMLSTTISSNNSQQIYQGSDPCDSISELQFNATKANDSVSWQTSLGYRLPGSDASAELRQSVTENLTQWSFTESSHQRANFTLTNLVGSYSPENTSGQNVVFVAHYDSRYIADRDANESKRNQPILGANDGASGVAVLIELGRIIPSLQINHDVTLFFTDAEDQGQPFMANTWSYGADAWVSNLTNDYKENISAYIVIDMIGDIYLDFTRVTSTSDRLWETITPIAAALGMIDGELDCNGNNGLSIYNPDPNDERGVIDDHVAAHNAGIPAINLIDINYGENASSFGGHWHTQNDTADKVSSQSLNYIGSILEIGLRTSAWTLVDHINEEDFNNTGNDNSESNKSAITDDIEKSNLIGYLAIIIVSSILLVILVADISVKR
tara:strand:+ start:3506 stop:4723 length:1218 start_codon:yes stop_codon:yes gene_type:complete